MKKEYTLSYREYDFIFVLEQETSFTPAPDMPGAGLYPYIRCKLFRSDVRDFDWRWEGYLEPNEKIEFQLIYKDQVNIKGYICLFHSVPMGDNFVFMDAWFGIGYEEHFEGNILEINHGEVPVPPGPGPKPKPDPGPIPPQEDVLPAGFNDLFPYLYMQYWPAIPPADEIYLVNFPPAFESSSFYTALLQSASAPNARVAMENEALAYINGTGGYAGDFISSAATLPYPLNIFPEVYDALYNNELTCQEDIILFLNDKKRETDEELYMSTTYPQQVERVWENIMALNIIEGYDPFTCGQLTKILVIDHLFSYLSSPPAAVQDEEIVKLVYASVILPAPVFPLPSFGTLSPPAGTLYSGTVVPYAIGDLQMVQHKLAGYEQGEIAHIENVLMGEIKKIRHKKSETVQNKNTYTGTNTSVHTSESHGDQFEKQVQETLTDHIAREYDYTGLQVSYGPPTTGKYDGKVTKTTDQALSKSPVEFARKIISATLVNLRKKVSEKREHILKNETEETVTHVINNQNGNGPIRGIYYWLNKIYKLRTMNYGKRFMFEFLVNKPALDVTRDINQDDIFPLLPPALLSPPITSYQDINAENYIEIGAYYGLYELPFPPPEQKYVSMPMNGNDFSSSVLMQVPDGYLPFSLTATYKIDSAAELIAGTKQASLAAGAGQQVLADPLGIYAGTPVQVSAENIYLPVLLDMTAVNTSPPSSPAYYMSLALQCNCSAGLYTRWQQQVYQAVLQAYQESLKKYEAETSDLKKNNNPQQTEMMVRKMVKDACKTILWEQYATLNGYSTTQLSPPEIVVNAPAYSQFFEDAYEWDKMVYTIDNSQPENVQENLMKYLDNELYATQLEKFITAGHIRVMVPLKNDYHYRILYYLSSGMIFYGEDHLAPVFTNDQQIAVKLKQVFDLSPYKLPAELEAWELRLPTDMQWLQDSVELPIFEK